MKEGDLVMFREGLHYPQYTEEGIALVVQMPAGNMLGVRVFHKGQYKEWSRAQIEVIHESR